MLGETDPVWVGVYAGKVAGFARQQRVSAVAARSHRQSRSLFLYTEVAYLIERFATIPEYDGSSMLDNSVLLLGTDNGDGRRHYIQNIPFLLAGNAGGFFRTGRVIEYPDPTPHNGILIAVCNAMGLPVTEFGNPAYCNGPLPHLS
jgi:hypothetical protein